ncbi:DUF3347 domain-containing protein [Flavobacteriaceae bacterium F89]|uniref:DUF3347 domain-containing protein n=1 Tax=Cerina litoralis TaxID=2874477 RepID=A0AAE3EVD2_9FLAO|nr:DUF3347 domain-containing protein [Cerina litoralis]MCG2460983.1 DUF3347 domain-containing protein [Cerina litoralis]
MTNRTNAVTVMKSISIFAFVALLISCKENQKQSNSKVESNSVEQTLKKEGIGITFTESEKEAIFDQYLNIRDALFNSDTMAAKEAAQELADEVSETKIKNAAEEIAFSDDIEMQRKAFQELSTEIEPLLKGSLASGEIYKQYCPMAFEHKGAAWLSDSKKILNPYFGEKMPRCGTVQETIQ